MVSVAVSKLARFVESVSNYMESLTAKLLLDSLVTFSIAGSIESRFSAFLASETF